MAHQIKDDKQEYQFTGGFTTPSGHEFHWYDTPKNERLVLAHASGSHIEFKSDGSVIIKSLKDMHVHSSVVSSASDGTVGSSEGSELTSQQIGTDYTLDVQGVLKIKARQIHIEGHDTVHMLAGTDLEMKASNTWVRAKEQVTVEGTTSIRLDADECTQAFRTLRQDIGTEEGENSGQGGKKGGFHKITNHGNFIIEQSDETAAMTIRSKGYLNLVCGQERVDLVGKYIEKPSEIAKEGKATWTQKCMKPEKADMNNVSTAMPGDLYYFGDAGITNLLAQERGGSSLNTMDGRHVEIKMGDDILTVKEGDQDIKIEEGKLDLMVKDKVTFEFEDEFKHTVEGKVELEFKDDYMQKVEGMVERMVEKDEMLEIKGEYKVMAEKIFLN